MTLAEYLSTFITPARLNLFEQALGQRTRYITVVLEDFFQAQNASAVLRTCDCFGIQDVHVIENTNKFIVHRDIAMGSSKWLSIRHWNQMNYNSLEAIRHLKSEGYRIVATTPHNNDQLLHEFDLTKGKTALIFGSELPGISKEVLKLSDEFVKIPMVGFTESLNVSVSAAIILHHLTLQLKKLPPKVWQLNHAEKEEIKLQWLRRTIKRSNLLETQFEKIKTNDEL